MLARLHVARPPPRPVLLFDGECSFCRCWVNRWQTVTAGQVDYLPFQSAEAAARFPEIPTNALERAVHLVSPDGSVASGAAAVVRALATVHRWPLWCYERVPTLAPFAETAYAAVARHRGLFSWLTRLLWGAQLAAPTFAISRELFLRGLALIYLIAFASLAPQVIGLIGANGVVPVREWMQTPPAGGDGSHSTLLYFASAPSLCWWNTSDAFLRAHCVAGIVLALLALGGIAPRITLLLLWLLYLSITVAADLFLGFQWDNLLLEAGFLGIFYAPWGILPSSARTVPPSRCVRWLLVWLLFRLMFLSGAVKLLSGDPLWQSLTALNFHYETQPLPPWTAWYAHHWPAWFQKVSAAGMFSIELVLPFCVFLPRRPRLVAAGGFVALQLAIFVTGNYCFFNLLTVVLCLPLLDDITLARGFLARWRRSPAPAPAPAPAPEAGIVTSRARPGVIAGRIAEWTLALLILAVTTMEMGSRLFNVRSWPEPVAELFQAVQPFRSINSYGLFAVMTTSRLEIVFEGSDDQSTWKPYEFPYKPGDVSRRPPFVAPHQPRLDWQLWFAALGSARENPWIMNVCLRLLQGSPAVLELLARNPFPKQPPKYVRALLYEYRFTTATERATNGAWWKRELKSTYVPEVHLR